MVLAGGTWISVVCVGYTWEAVDAYVYYREYKKVCKCMQDVEVKAWLGKAKLTVDGRAPIRRTRRGCVFC